MGLNNVYLYDRLVKLKHLRRNRRYIEFVNDISNIDSIQNFKKFKKHMMIMISGNVHLMYCGYSGASYFYGYYDSLLRYAGFTYKDFRIPLFSNIEHGMANIDNNLDKISNNIFSYCSNTNHRKDELHKISKDILYFSVGPYIHYAEKFYTEDEEKKLKNQLGKILLVFPFHTYEDDTSDKGEEYNFADIIYRKYADAFDTIMVCSYWNDINSSIIEEFSKRGAMIVSAGFRGDRLFVSRLKTIISLSDSVVMDEVGTQLGFCIYMKKNTYLEKSPSRFDDEKYAKNVKLFEAAFFSEDLMFNDKQKKEQLDLYEQFWGERYLRNRKEMEGIFHILSEGMKMSGFNSARWKKEHIPSRLMEKFSRDEPDGVKYRLLREALGITL